MAYDPDFELPEELDPVHKAQLQEQYDTEIALSMTEAYRVIHDMGVEKWANRMSFGNEKKIRILENMVKWYADPEREEYEIADELNKGLLKLKKSCQ
jgi:hypothetical protein